MTTQRIGRRGRLTAFAAAGALAIAACGGSDEAADDAPDEAAADDTESGDDGAGDDDAGDTGDDAAACDTVDEVSLQLQWFTQAQFAGYYAAIDQGDYADQCLEVEILEGAVELVPQTELANGTADFALAWVPKALQSREAGADITNISQVFARSGTLQVSFADSGIESPADFAGRTIGNWGFGNEYEVFAAIGEAGLDPATDVTLVGQQFDMIALLEGEIDAAEAMIYNEYAQVLEAINPETGELYQPEDFNVINYEEEGVGMLQDASWADESRLADEPEYRDQAVRFVAASLQGWAYCRDNPAECATIVTDAGSTLGESHQLWMMNEVNKLIWPAPDGVGVLNQADYDRTVEISQGTPNLEGATVLTAAPDDGAAAPDITAEALALLGDDVDVTGEGFTPIEEELREGGE